MIRTQDLGIETVQIVSFLGKPLRERELLEELALSGNLVFDVEEDTEREVEVMLELRTRGTSLDEVLGVIFRQSGAAHPKVRVRTETRPRVARARALIEARAE